MPAAPNVLYIRRSSDEAMRVAIQRLYFLIWRVQLVISDFGSNGAHGDGDRSEEAMYLGVQHFFTASLVVSYVNSFRTCSAGCVMSGMVHGCVVEILMRCFCRTNNVGQLIDRMLRWSFLETALMLAIR
jgi:hypothetical protein